MSPHFALLPFPSLPPSSCSMRQDQPVWVHQPTSFTPPFPSLYPTFPLAGSGNIEFIAVDSRSCYRTITLVNDSNEARLFKVLTTAPTRYRVKPASGSLEAGTSIEVHLVLTPQENVPDDLTEWSKDKFQIKSLSRSYAGGSDASAEAIAEAWKSAPPEAVEATRLRCSHAHSTPEEGEEAGVNVEPASAPGQPTSSTSNAASPAPKAASTPPPAPKTTSATSVIAKAAVVRTPRARDSGDQFVSWLVNTSPMLMLGSLLLKAPSPVRERFLLPAVMILAVALVWYADRIAAWMLSGSLSGLLMLLLLCTGYAAWLVGTPSQRMLQTAGSLARAGSAGVSRPTGGSTPRRTKKAT